MSTDPNGLPVNTILEVLQSVEVPELQQLDPDQWYRIENALREDISEQAVPVFVADAISYHQTVLKIKGREYWIREMQFSDVVRISEIGPQIIQVFFGGDEKRVAMMNPQEVVAEIVHGALSKRVGRAISALSYQIIDILAGLLIDPLDQSYQDADFLFGQRPEVAMDAIKKILEVESLFFSYVQQSLPENMKGWMSTLSTGIIGNILGGSPQESLTGQKTKS